MKFELETIPIWDSLNEDSECLMCSLMEKAEKDSLKYYLGSSVMNPETRVQVNSIGFCSHHLDLLAKTNKSQSLAVIERSYMEKSLEILEKNFFKVEQAKKGKNTNKEILELNKTIDNRLKGCLICNKMQDRLNRYAYTVSALWEKDIEFRKALEASKGFCLVHLKSILALSKESLNSEEQKEFAKSMISLERKNLSRINEEVIWMTQKFKSENLDKPWENSADSHKRLIYKFIGKGKIT